MSYTSLNPAADFPVIELDTLTLPVSVLRLIPEEYTHLHQPQAQTTFERWDEIYRRQQIWNHTAVALSYYRVHMRVPMLRVFEKINAIKPVDLQQSCRMLDAIEMQYFGTLVTRSANWAPRRSYWAMLQLRYQGVTPTDLVDLGGFGQYVLAARTEMEELDSLIHRFVQDRDEMETNGGLERYEDVKKHYNQQVFYKRVYQRDGSIRLTEVQAKHIRRWAGLYLNAGYEPSYQCELRIPPSHKGANASIYLSQPRKRQEQSSDRARPLAFWRDYGLRGLRDVHERDYWEAKSLPNRIYCDPELMNYGHCGRYLSEFPEAYRPRIVLMAEEVQDDCFGGFYVEPEAVIYDQLEERIFGQVITSGEVKERTKYWMGMWRHWRQEHAQLLKLNEPKLNMHVHWTELAYTAQGWIMQGADPENVCSLVARGRGGLAKPKPASQAGYGDVALHHWVCSSFTNHLRPRSQYADFCL